MDFRVRSRKLNIFIGPVSARVKEISSAPPSRVMHSGIVCAGGKAKQKTHNREWPREFYRRARDASLASHDSIMIKRNIDRFSVT
jgi:hypothetical protein